MARPIKEGLDYFPLDVTFFSDGKIKSLRRTFGTIGIAVYVNILCKVYRNGYYYRFVDEEELAYDIAEEVAKGEEIPLAASSVKGVIQHMIDCEMIDKKLYEEQKVITGVAIQKRFAFFSENARRKSEIAEYRLLPKNEVSSAETPVNVAETQVNVTETPVNVAFSTQSKVKESKVNKSTIVCSGVNNNILNYIKTAHKDTTPQGKHKNVILTEEEHEALNKQGIPDQYIFDYFSERLYEGGYSIGDHAKTIWNWWKKDRARLPWNKGTDTGTFDTDEFFQKALNKKFKKEV